MIAVADYGMGNLRSIEKALAIIGADFKVSCCKDDFEKASKIILPGVGSFKEGMANLRNRGLDKILEKEAIINKKPILGICLGMQLLFKTSGEGGMSQGLGFINGNVVRFAFDNDLKFKIPHVGWNDVFDENINEMPLFKNIPNHSDFYFVHSYHAVLDEKTSFMETNYGYNFISAVQKGNIFGVQFHPEKSQKYGLALLRNFADMGEQDA